jgi:hypothetical protein
MLNSSSSIQAIALLPVDREALAEIQAMLRERDVFTSGYEYAGIDVYDPATYLRDQLLYDTSFCFRYDRNVLSRLVEVVHGRRWWNRILLCMSSDQGVRMPMRRSNLPCFGALTTPIRSIGRIWQPVAPML